MWQGQIDHLGYIPWNLISTSSGDNPDIHLKLPIPATSPFLGAPGGMSGLFSQAQFAWPSHEACFPLSALHCSLWARAENTVSTKGDEMLLETQWQLIPKAPVETNTAEPTSKLRCNQCPQKFHQNNAFGFFFKLYWICYNIGFFSYVWAFWLWGMWDLSFSPRGQTVLPSLEG